MQKGAGGDERAIQKTYVDLFKWKEDINIHHVYVKLDNANGRPDLFTEFASGYVSHISLGVAVLCEPHIRKKRWNLIYRLQNPAWTPS